MMKETKRKKEFSEKWRDSEQLRRIKRRARANKNEILTVINCLLSYLKMTLSSLC
jgi:hypothetical protein